MSDLVVFALGGAVVFAGFLLAFRLAGFKAQTPADYSDGPVLDIQKHLNGPLICEGVLYGPTGRVVSRFVADMHGTWDGDSGHLTEDFRYDSGTEQKREWFLTIKNDGTFDAEAPDVVGTGRGVQLGSAINLKYRIQLAETAGGHTLDVTDWMYLLDNGTIVNRSQMRKFGIKVAELVATIRKADV